MSDSYPFTLDNSEKFLFLIAIIVLGIVAKDCAKVPPAVNPILTNPFPNCAQPD